MYDTLKLNTIFNFILKLNKRLLVPNLQGLKNSCKSKNTVLISHQLFTCTSFICICIPLCIGTSSLYIYGYNSRMDIPIDPNIGMPWLSCYLSSTLLNQCFSHCNQSREYLHNSSPCWIQTWCSRLKALVEKCPPLAHQSRLSFKAGCLHRDFLRDVFVTHSNAIQTVGVAFAALVARIVGSFL